VTVRADVASDADLVLPDGVIPDDALAQVAGLDAYGD